MDTNVKSRWIDKENSDVVVVTGFLDNLVLFDYCNNASKKSGSRSVKDFTKQFKLLDAGPAPKADMVNHPPHYKSLNGVSCTEVVRHMMFFGGSCFKYLYRCGNKWDDIGDLKKAVRCAEQAKLDNEKVCWSAIIGINTVASVKNKNIGAAMNYISTEDWQWVIVSIKAEIARLESE